MYVRLLSSKAEYILGNVPGRSTRNFRFGAEVANANDISSLVLKLRDISEKKSLDIYLSRLESSIAFKSWVPVESLHCTVRRSYRNNRLFVDHVARQYRYTNGRRGTKPQLMLGDFFAGSLEQRRSYPRQGSH